MNEIFGMALAIGVGILTGAFFFGGLHWTIQKMAVSKKPLILFLLSIILRTAVSLTGFYFVGRGNWIRMIVCLLGFILARITVTWGVMRTTESRRSQSEQEADHAT